MGTLGLVPLSWGEMEVNTSTRWVPVQVCLYETLGTYFLKNNWDTVTAVEGCQRKGSWEITPQGMLGLQEAVMSYTGDRQQGQGPPGPGELSNST